MNNYIRDLFMIIFVETPRGSPRRVSLLHNSENTVGYSFSGVILLILEPCRPRPAINPFWSKKKA
jgi:hypothetical protein